MTARRVNTLGDLMNSPALVVSPDDSVAAAAASMVKAGTGSVVVAAPDGSVLGILTERDLLRLAAEGVETGAVPVRQIMTAEPFTAPAELSPAQALAEMGERGFRHIPVVENGVAQGVVSMRDLMGIASIEAVEHPGELAPRGLEGVVVAETEVGDVRGREGFYHYRQYSAVELAEQRSLEDVWHLMLRGSLPATTAEQEAFAGEVRSLRTIPPMTAALLPQVARAGGTVLGGLRTAVSLLGTELGFEPVLDTPPEELASQALRVTAVMPSLIMGLHRLRQGLEPVEPDPGLGYAASYLEMLTGRDPRPEDARAVEQYLITTIDHGFNASTFTARVITSTGADLGAAVVGAIGALSGPLHGGAPSRALDLLDEIGTVDRAGEVVRRRVEAGERIMGFGHRVYKTRDPRSVLLREVALRLGGQQAELAAEVEDVVVRTLAELKPGRELYANVEYYAGVVMEKVGLPAELFTPTFTASRTIGWCAHILEQAADNRIIRPTAGYVGPPPPQPVPALD